MKDSPRVYTPPPLIFICFVLTARGLNQLMPMPFLVDGYSLLFGLPLCVFALILFLRCAKLFKRAQTDIKPWKPTTSIIQSGPYRFSRNPIYLSFVILGIGLACIMNTFWGLLAMALFVPVINILVIHREERYLRAKFGDEYLTYMHHVRRWI